MHSDAAFLIPCLPDCLRSLQLQGKYCSGRGAGRREGRGKEQGYGAHYGMGKVSDGNPFSGEPYAIFATDKDKIESPEEMEPSGIWIERIFIKRITRLFM